MADSEALNEWLVTPGMDSTFCYHFSPSPERLRLVGEWHLESAETGPGIAQPKLLEGTPITMTFSLGGELAGQVDCQSYAGRFSVDGASVSIGSLYTEQEACDDGSITDMYFQLMDGAWTSAISGNRLTIEKAGGNQLTFIRSPEQ
jgi:hypothetical protein